MLDKSFPARGDTSPEAVRARIAEFCEWFGVEPVKLKVRKGNLYLTDDLLSWCRTHGASLDWIYAGDPKSMAATFRGKYARTSEQQEMLDLVSKLSLHQQEAFVKGLEEFASGRITIEQFEAQVKGDQNGVAA